MLVSAGYRACKDHGITELVITANVLTVHYFVASFCSISDISDKTEQIRF